MYAIGSGYLAIPYPAWHNLAAVAYQLKLPRLLIPILITFAIPACALVPVSEQGIAATDSNPAITPSATAFQPVTATAEENQISVWIDPAVPIELRQPVKELIDSSDGSYIEAEDASAAQVRVEPQPDRPLTQWVYAVVAAFPTVRDEVSLFDLQELWKSASGTSGMLVTAESAALLRKGFGEESGDAVDQVNGEDLLGSAWSEPGRISVIPFGDLEPRWKVLRLDGQSPIEKSFDPQTYPLLIPFGLSGPRELLDDLAGKLEWPATNREPGKMTVIVMTGVTALTRATAWRMEERGILYPAEAIGDWLRDADITHISNEVSFWEGCPYPDPVQEGLKFCSDPDYFPLLESIGVDVVELTGNHNMDFGAAPYLETLDLYHESGWQTFGGGRDLAAAVQPAMIEHNGNRIAFIGCNQPGPRSAWATEVSPGAAPCSESALLAETKRLRAQGILTIFTFQWSELATPSEAQIEAFTAAAQAGASIVSGSQAHQPQPMAFESKAFIHYGLGNLFFDQMQSLALRQQFMDRHVIYDGRYISTELLTSILENYARPRPMEPEERSEFLEDMFTQSGW
jgi:hypothetical protein